LAAVCLLFYFSFTVTLFLNPFLFTHPPTSHFLFLAFTQTSQISSRHRPLIANFSLNETPLRYQEEDPTGYGNGHFYLGLDNPVLAIVL
jgi:hypothetical protein